MTGSIDEKTRERIRKAARGINENDVRTLFTILEHRRETAKLLYGAIQHEQVTPEICVDAFEAYRRYETLIKEALSFLPELEKP